MRGPVALVWARPFQVTQISRPQKMTHVGPLFHFTNDFSSVGLYFSSKNTSQVFVSIQMMEDRVGLN